MQTNYSDQELLELLRKDADQAIELLFRQYYAYVCKVVYQIVTDAQVAEDIGQDVFFELWRKKGKLKISTSLKAYLKRAAVNKTLNYLRDRKIKWDDEPELPKLASDLPDANRPMETAELQRKIDDAIDQLPERCRIVFMLSRQEDLSYQEIADYLNISTKTVENQISKALKHLRSVLKPYLSGGLLILLALLL